MPTAPDLSELPLDPLIEAWRKRNPSKPIPGTETACSTSPSCLWRTEPQGGLVAYCLVMHLITWENGQAGTGPMCRGNEMMFPPPGPEGNEPPL